MSDTTQEELLPLPLLSEPPMVNGVIDWRACRAWAERYARDCVRLATAAAEAQKERCAGMTAGQWRAFAIQSGKQEADANQCIATLKAENVRLKAAIEDAERCELKAVDRYEAAQSQVAAMAGLLEEARIHLHNVGNWGLRDDIDAALAAWKGK